MLRAYLIQLPEGLLLYFHILYYGFHHQISIPSRFFQTGGSGDSAQHSLGFLLRSLTTRHATLQKLFYPVKPFPEEIFINILQSDLKATLGAYLRYAVPH